MMRILHVCLWCGGKGGSGWRVAAPSTRRQGGNEGGVEGGLVGLGVVGVVTVVVKEVEMWRARVGSG